MLRLLPFPHPSAFPSPLCLSLIPLPFPHPSAFPYITNFVDN